jgi:fumarate reductase flavoprotein subunit
MAQGEVAWAIYDARIHAIAEAEEEYAEMAAMGAVTWADTLDTLAEATGLCAACLAPSVTDYNRAAAGASPDRFGRRDFGLGPLVPPYGAVKVQPGLFHTQGGLLVDRDARVRRRGGGVVPGLYAGGGAAAGISGRDGASGYASGNGLVTALVLGRRAGLSAAAAAVQPA